MDGWVDRLIPVYPRKHSFCRGIKIGRTTGPDKHNAFLKIETVKGLLAAKNKQLVL